LNECRKQSRLNGAGCRCIGSGPVVEECSPTGLPLPIVSVVKNAGGASFTRPRP